MNLLFVFAFLALLATLAMLVRAILSMSRGGAADRENSPRLMFRRLEFQAAAVGLVLAAALFAGGWLQAPSESGLTVELGIVPAQELRERFGADSNEAKAYGGVAQGEDAYLVTVALTEQASGKRVEDANVTATVAPLGMNGASRQLQRAAFASAVSYGTYFRMPTSGTYRIDLAVERPGRSGADMIRLEYKRPLP